MREDCRTENRWARSPTRSTAARHSWQNSRFSEGLAKRGISWNDFSKEQGEEILEEETVETENEVEVVAEETKMEDKTEDTEETETEEESVNG